MMKIFNLNNVFNVIIVGAGAAGLMCAIESAKRGRHVLVVEHNDRIGKKILISGGGRCNFTNLATTSQNFISQNPHFCKSALAQFTPQDFVTLVEKHKIAHHPKTPGQLFCDHSSKEIVNMLEKECEALGVTILVSCKISQVFKESQFTVQTNRGDFTTDSLVVATGGLSFANLGATPWGLKLAEQFELKVTPVIPGLVPLLFGQKEKNIFSSLAGISLLARATYNKTSFLDPILFTHTGLSGPAILQISSYWKEKNPIILDLLPQMKFEDELKSLKQSKSQKTLKNILSHHWPERFAKAYCDYHDIDGVVAQMPESQIKTVLDAIHLWSLIPLKKAGYEKAEVMVGGVSTDEVSSKTFEAKKVSGLYFVGEVLDVTGWLGGYNFQWAWASGFVAGQNC